MKAEPGCGPKQGPVLTMGPMALVGGKHSHIIQGDMTSDLKRRVLLKLTEALQDEDVNALRDVELYRGWGDVIYVRIHTGISPSFEHRNRLRSFSKPPSAAHSARIGTR